MFLLSGDVRPATGEQWSDPAIEKLYELTAEIECEVRLNTLFIIIFRIWILLQVFQNPF